MTIRELRLIAFKILRYSYVERLERRVPLSSYQEDNRMQSANAGMDAGEHAEIQSKPVASEAFGQILSSGLPSLYRGAYRLLGNAADAEDAVQDALLAAYTHLDQFRGQSKMSTWLASIVHNSARMQLRRQLRHIHVPIDEPIGEIEDRSVSPRLADRRPSPEDECQRIELSSRLTLFQSRLTPTLRKTFQLRDIDGLSIRETARILGVPNGTVKAQSARARKKLTESMRRALRPRTRNLTRSTVLAPWQGCDHEVHQMDSAYVFDCERRRRS
jgi:RNA polymerase sigma-70 factor, ECF subfamily